MYICSKFSLDLVYSGTKYGIVRFNTTSSSGVVPPISAPSIVISVVVEYPLPPSVTIIEVASPVFPITTVACAPVPPPVIPTGP